MFQSNILITGCNGYIGAELAKFLQGKGGKIRAVLRKGASYAGSEDIVNIDDIGPSTDWEEALQGIDIVIHLAARAHVLQEASLDPLAAYRRINVEGTRRLAESAHRSGVKRFIYISSIGVHGISSQFPITEESDIHPHNHYATSKYEGELAVQDLCNIGGMKYVIIRPPLVYGPHVKANFLRLLQIVDRNIPLPLGAVKNKRSYISLNNLVSFIFACLLHPSAANQSFLVSDGADLSTTELLQKLKNILGKPAYLIPVPSPMLKIGAKALGMGDISQRLLYSLQIDIGKSKKLLEWTPPFEVDEELEKTALWYLRQKKNL